MKKSTTQTQRFFRDLIGWLFLGVVILALAWMAGYLKTPQVESAPRATPTPCRAGVEGKDFCPDQFQTSVARPGDFAPRRGTPKPKGARP
jgi:hypothetical protein